MYVLAPNQQIKKYPYTTVDLKKDNKNVSFPVNLNEAALAEWHIFPVINTPKPSYDEKIELVVEEAPIFSNGTWARNWKKVSLSTEEQQAMKGMQKIRIRNQRNSLLAETDWRFRSDLNPSQAWIDYCQALRDITGQEGFPWAVQWPTKPE